MPTIVYVHGFLSSPKSYKAQISKNYFQQHHSDLTFICPQLSSYPGEAVSQLKTTVENLTGDVFAIGSSLGGYWSTYGVEKGWFKKAVLVNPAVDPHTRFHEFINTPLKSYSSDDVYLLTQQHLNELVATNVTITKPDAYWLMLQTGDETLDYRQAQARYNACQQYVEDGGDHSFQNFEKHLPEIARFFGLD